MSGMKRLFHFTSSFDLVKERSGNTCTENLSPPALIQSSEQSEAGLVAGGPAIRVGTLPSAAHGENGRPSPKPRRGRTLRVPHPPRGRPPPPPGAAGSPRSRPKRRVQDPSTPPRQEGAIPGPGSTPPSPGCPPALTVPCKVGMNE